MLRTFASRLGILLRWLLGTLAVGLVYLYSCCTKTHKRRYHSGTRREQEVDEGREEEKREGLIAAPSISFSGSGMLYPYQIGVAEYIKAVYVHDDIRCAGISGGFTGAASIAFDMPPEHHLFALVEACKSWTRRTFGMFFDSTSNWMAPYKPIFVRLQHEVPRVSEEGRIALGLTQLKGLRPLVWRSFKSYREFMYAVTCTQRVPPFYRAPGRFEGKLVLDGGISANFVQLTPRSSAITVSPFAASSADVKPKNGFPLLRMFQPPSVSEFVSMLEMGFKDAHRQQEIFLRKGFRPRQVDREILSDNEMHQILKPLSARLHGVANLKTFNQLFAATDRLKALQSHNEL